MPASSSGSETAALRALALDLEEQFAAYQAAVVAEERLERFQTLTAILHGNQPLLTALYQLQEEKAQKTESHPDEPPPSNAHTSADAPARLILSISSWKTQPTDMSNEWRQRCAGAGFGITQSTQKSTPEPRTRAKHLKASEALLEHLLTTIVCTMLESCMSYHIE